MVMISRLAENPEKIAEFLRYVDNVTEAQDAEFEASREARYEKARAAAVTAGQLADLFAGMPRDMPVQFMDSEWGRSWFNSGGVSMDSDDRGNPVIVIS